MTTLKTLIDTHTVDVHDHLDRDEIVPVHHGLQFQGDVAIVPRSDVPAAATPVPRQGAPVVRGENGGNTHLLLGEGDVRCDVRAADADNLTLAVLTVADGSTAWLAHPEHGYTGIAPGTYELRRQREQADELRLVAD